MGLAELRNSTWRQLHHHTLMLLNQGPNSRDSPHTADDGIKAAISQGPAIWLCIEVAYEEAVKAFVACQLCCIQAMADDLAILDLRRQVAYPAAHEVQHSTTC